MTCIPLHREQGKPFGSRTKAATCRLSDSEEKLVTLLEPLERKRKTELLDTKSGRNEYRQISGGKNEQKVHLDFDTLDADDGIYRAKRVGRRTRVGTERPVDGH